ncbi:MAG: DNA-protecting protein DprA [Desulfobacter sp.]|nr:MAG: DNA-protecting protein DprA [Desulfobacter sp.]
MEPLTDTYLPWFILREIPGLNNRVLKGLIQKFKTPDAAFGASPKSLAAVKGLGPKGMRALSRHREYKKKALAVLGRVQRAGLNIVTLSDTEYPALLKKINDPPLFLTYAGTLDGRAPCISIVGSRKATRYGRDTAEHLAGCLSNRGFTVVSGMALGIDTAAHKGALNARGRTAAVLGSGLCRIYPRQNHSLYQKIAEHGTALSEFAPDTPPLPGYFPLRNRIIAGMSVGTIVVEAAEKSGSLITARLAGEYNREVFAVPGSIRSNTSRGTHALIRQGAKLIENEKDIIDELGHLVHEEPSKDEKCTPGKNPKPVMDKHQSLIYNLLDPYPVHIDDISAGTGLESHVTAAALLDMELSGLILRHPGNYYSKSEE